MLYWCYTDRVIPHNIAVIFHVIQVNLVVSESKTLGISIRGGNEFGLGIYITQVDYGSPADNAGLKVGVLYSLVCVCVCVCVVGEE